MKRLACFGSCCIDYYTDLNGGSPFAGGGPVNAAVKAAEKGMPVSLLSCAGDDEYGDLLRNALQNRGIDLSHFRTEHGKTAFCQVDIKDHERILGDYDEGVMAGWKLSDDDISFIMDHDIVLSDLWGRQEEFLPRLREKEDLIIAYDAADRPDDPAAMLAMPYCDLFLFSSESDLETTVGDMLEVLRMGPKVVIAMCGHKGSLCMNSDGILKYQIIPEEEIKDTIGAGDSYIAGFLYEYAKGSDLKECIKKASEAALPVLKHHGAFVQ